MSEHERPETVRGHKFIRIKSGRLISYWEAFSLAERARVDLGRAVSRAFKLAADDYDLERLEWLLDNIEGFVRSVRDEVEKRRGIKTQEERIALLRNTAGRTPEEAAAFRKKADELEARLTDPARPGVPAHGEGSRVVGDLEQEDGE